MPYGTPARSGDPEWKGSFGSYFTDGMNYGEDARIHFELLFEGSAVHGPNWEAVADEQWQSFVDHVASWPGFNTSDPTYPTIHPTTFTAGKTYPTTEEVTPT